MSTTIIGQMALFGRFPRYRETLGRLAQLCDGLCIRVDLNGDVPTDFSIEQEIMKKYQIPVYVKRSSERWNQWKWREEMVRMLDQLPEVDVVLSLDEDEAFGVGFHQDLRNFINSDKNYAMMGYEKPMPSKNGFMDQYDRVYPAASHCKMYKFRPGLTFNPYRGYAKPTNFVHESPFAAQSKILHYCFYDQACRDTRKGAFEKYILRKPPEVKGKERKLMLGDGKKRKGWTTIDAYDQRADYNTAVPPLPKAVKAVQWDQVCGIHFI